MQWLRGVIALQCSVMRHLSAKQMSPSNRDSKQSQQADVKPCVEAKELSSQSPTHRTLSPSPFSKPCSTRVGPQGAPVLHNPQAPSEQLDRCSISSEKPCHDCRPLNGLLEGRLKVNGPVVHEGGLEDHKPNIPQSPHVPEPSLTNHIRTEKSSALLSPGAQKEGPCPLAPLCASSASGGAAASLSSGTVTSSVVDTRTLAPPRAAQGSAADRLAPPLPPSGMGPLSLNQSQSKPGQRGDFIAGLKL